jgi:F-type H+-transporting ATPase subunit b
MAFYLDAEFWVAVGFVTVVGVFIYRRLPAFAGRMLDERAAKIDHDLNEARRLRDEAEALLGEYKKKSAQAEKEAESILAEARAEASRFAAEAREQLKAQIERRTQQAQEKIAQAEATAMAEIRGLAADVATAAAEKLISARIDESRASDLIAGSLSELADKLN